MENKINAVVRMFSFYGFVSCPLSRKKIVSLIIRGKTISEIYEIGCNVNCGY